MAINAEKRGCVTDSAGTKMVLSEIVQDNSRKEASICVDFGESYKQLRNGENCFVIKTVETDKDER